jgi:hypothetical protein
VQLVHKQGFSIGNQVKWFNGWVVGLRFRFIFCGSGFPAATIEDGSLPQRTNNSGDKVVSSAMIHYSGSIDIHAFSNREP